jgi:decaprenylphospho-beta-D-erythro-pentofuranosid-2-ulose 2-reductase
MARVLILGATSSIARGVAEQFARRHYDLILAGRDEPELKLLASDLGVRYGAKSAVCVLDVRDCTSHEAVLESCLESEGGSLEGAILCAGYLGDQVAAQTDAAEARRILETNFTGCVSVLEIIARRLENRGRGFICALSSVAGDRGRQSNYFYGAAKGGLSIYLEGLRNRLFPSRVCVITVKPGFVDTAMTFGKRGLFLVASPESVARGLIKAVVGGKDVVYIPWFWRPIMFLIRLIPQSIFKRMRL